MKKKKTLLCLSYVGRESAVAKVIDLQSQVVVAFLEREGDHLTLHHQHDNPRILMTYRSKNKPPTKSDSFKVDIAKHLGWKYPERHAQYYVHQEMVTESLKMPWVTFNDGNSEVVERLTPFITLSMSFIECRHPIPEKYSKIPRVTLNLDSYEFNLSGYFTRDEAEFEGLPLVPIQTSLGYVSFAVGKEKLPC